jgi:hypothetical protein
LIAPGQTDDLFYYMQLLQAQNQQQQQQQQPTYAYMSQLVPQFTPTRPGMPPPPVYTMHQVPFSAPPPPPTINHPPPSTLPYYDASRDPRLPAAALLRAAAAGGAQATAPTTNTQPTAPAFGGLRTSVVFPTSQFTPTAGDDEWTRVRVTQRRQAINLGSPATSQPQPSAPTPEAAVPAPVAAPEEVVPAPVAAPASEPNAAVFAPSEPVLEPEAPTLEPEAVVDESAPPALGSSASESAFVVEAEDEVLPSPSANKRARPRAPTPATAADEAYDAAIAAVLATADDGRPRRARRPPTRFVPGNI